MENLMLNMIDEFLNIDEEQKEIWKVKDDVGADWCLDRIIESKEALRRFEMTVNTKMAQLEHNLKKEKDRTEREIVFFESKLREYFELMKKYAKETKTQKSYKLPSGTLKMKNSSTAFDYDKAKLLEYAETEGLEDLIKVTKDFKWADFKKVLEIKGESIINKETGEIMEVEGLRLVTKPEEFMVEV